MQVDARAYTCDIVGLSRGHFHAFVDSTSVLTVQQEGRGQIVLEFGENRRYVSSWLHG